MTSYKKILLRICLLFLGLALLLTFFSKTIYNFNLPNVTVAFPETGAVTQTATGQGVASFALEHAYYANAAGRIYPLVEAGQDVSVGDPLYTIVEDTDQLQATLDSLLYQRDALALQLKNAQTELDRAADRLQQEAASDPIFDQDMVKLELSVRNAQQELLAMEDYYREQEAFQANANAQATDALYRAYQERIEQAEDRTEERSIREDFQRELAQLEAEQAMAAKTFAYQSQQDLANRRQMVLDLQLSYQQAKEQKQTNRVYQAQSLSGLQYQVDQVRLSIRENEKAISKMQQQIANGGELTVTAEESGLVSRLGFGVSRGAPVSWDQQILSIGQQSEGFRTSISLPETVNYLRVGDAVNMRLVTRRQYYVEGTIRSLRTVDGRLQVDIQFSDDGLVGGEGLELTVQRTSELYMFVVPNSAVKSDTFGEYVLYVEKKKGFWRDTYYAKRLYVGLLEQNSYQAGIFIYEKERVPVIINSDRFITEGDRVRIVSGSDLLESR